MIAIQVFVQNRSHSKHKEKKITWCYANTEDTAKPNITHEEGVSCGAQYLGGGLHTPALLTTLVLTVFHYDTAASLHLVNCKIKALITAKQLLHSNNFCCRFYNQLNLE